MSTVRSFVGFMARGLAIFWILAGATLALETIQVLNYEIPVSGIEGLNNPYAAFNRWINELLLPTYVLDYFDNNYSPRVAHYLTTYLRDFAAGSTLYYTVAGLWHIWIYNIRGDRYFTKQGARMPTTATILDQIAVSQFAMLLYAGMPVLSEFLIETGYTMTYWSVDEIGGWGNYAIFTFVYFWIVEFGVYWMHRTLHTNKFLYKYVHGVHHKYNKPELLTPWCSVAFNPLDGCLQASPYLAALFLCPCHYITHVVLLFCTAIWATNIHDALIGNTEPIMGSKYHLLHHTHYRYNHGQYFILCDYLFGTLRRPVPEVDFRNKD